MATEAVDISVREAKNRFSELVRRAAHGETFTITSHGEPRARLSSPQVTPKPFRPDWAWLRDARVAAAQPLAESVVRDDRDGRD